MHSSAGTGRRRRCSCAARCRSSPASLRRLSSGRWRNAMMSNRGSSCATARAGRWPTDRFAPRTSGRFPRATGRCWCRASTCIRSKPMPCCGDSHFAPYARLDDLMVSHAAPGRRRRPALRFVRRLPAAGQRAAALAVRPPGRSRAEARACRSGSCGASRPGTNTCWRPATCSTCRRTTRTTASPSTPARPIRSDFARRRQRTGRRVPRFPARRARPARTLRRSRSRADARAGENRRRDAAAMRANACARFAGIGATVARFLGCWLSEPKPAVFFDPPTPPSHARRSPRARRKHGLRLEPAHATALR